MLPQQSWLDTQPAPGHLVTSSLMQGRKEFMKMAQVNPGVLRGGCSEWPFRRGNAGTGWIWGPKQCPSLHPAGLPITTRDLWPSLSCEGAMESHGMTPGTNVKHKKIFQGNLLWNRDYLKPHLSSTLFSQLVIWHCHSLMPWSGRLTDLLSLTLEPRLTCSAPMDLHTGCRDLLGGLLQTLSSRKSPRSSSSHLRRLTLPPRPCCFPAPVLSRWGQKEVGQAPWSFEGFNRG